MMLIRHRSPCTPSQFQEIRLACGSSAEVRWQLHVRLGNNAHPRSSMMRMMRMMRAMRSMVLLSTLLGACTVGEVPRADGGGMTSTTDRNTCEARPVSVLPPYNHVSLPAGPRAGTACLDAGCHGAGGAGGQFAFAGTVYKETAAVTAAGGATVRIFKPGNDTSLGEATTDSAGNFIIRNPASFAAFPYETHVTACGAATDIRPMLSAVTAADANCGTGGSCHGAGGTQGAVYLSD
jgi:hypothetical protein